MSARCISPCIPHCGTSAQDHSAASYQVNTCSHRSEYISLIGSLERREGCRIATGGSNNFVARVEATSLPKHVMTAIAPLFESLKMLNRQISEADAELEKIVREDEVVKAALHCSGRRAGNGYDLGCDHRRCIEVQRSQAGALLPRAGSPRTQFRRAATSGAHQQGGRQPRQNLTRRGSVSAFALAVGKEQNSL
jgi:transposase